LLLLLAARLRHKETDNAELLPVRNGPLRVPAAFWRGAL